MTIYQGNAHVYGSHITPAGFDASNELAPAAEFVLADVDPDFAQRVQPGDVLVTGENFGAAAGDTAAEALLAAGIAVVLAKSFTPEFVRNAHHAGLPVFLLDDHRTEMTDPVTIDTERGVLINGITGHEAQITPVEPD